MTQLGVFVRNEPEEPWKWMGFFSDSNSALIAYNLVEMRYPRCEAMWFEPDVVFDSMTEEDEADD